MQIVITAVGPDNRGLADPIIHHVTGQGANIAEIQMYDHDEQSVFAMLLRFELAIDNLASLRNELMEIGKAKGLSVRVWSPDERKHKPRLAICTTLRTETPLALLQSIRDGHIKAEAAVVLGNQPVCQSLAKQFGVEWQSIAKEGG